MPRSNRPRAEPTDDWQQVSLALSYGSGHQPQGAVRTLAALALLVSVPTKQPLLKVPRR